LKFGTFIRNTPPEEIAATARKAEALGYDSLWTGDHVMPVIDHKPRYGNAPDGRFPTDEPWHDPMLTLTYAAAVTTKIKIAPGVLVVPLRNPFMTAKAVASLDILSNGRFIFGIGIGWYEEEFAAIGMPFKDRALRTREYIEMMKVLWTEDRPVYEGKTVSVKGVTFYPKPIQKPHPPIVVGGDSDLAMKRTVRYGDGWYGIARSLDGARKLIAKLKEAQRVAGRTRPIEITLSLRPGHLQTLDEMKQLAEMGVDRALAGLPTRALTQGQLTQFHDEVMAKF
jgi:probable F420-dependent oxidoreductase